MAVRQFAVYLTDCPRTSHFIAAEFGQSLRAVEEILKSHPEVFGPDPKDPDRWICIAKELPPDEGPRFEQSFFDEYEVNSGPPSPLSSDDEGDPEPLPFSTDEEFWQSVLSPDEKS